MTATGSRAFTLALVALAAVFPLGALSLHWIWPSRENMPRVTGQLNAPVLLITVAGLRADHLHHLGYSREITPALDRVAEQGVSFRTCWAQSNEPLASAAALLTSRCPSRAGVQRAGDQLKNGHETVAEVFQAAGFHTAAVVADPELLDANLQQGFDVWQPRPSASADEVVNEGLAQIDAAHDAPWLVWLDFSDLLEPYGGAALPASAFAPDAPAGFGAAAGDYDLTPAALAARGWGETQTRWLAARYDAALQRLDAALSQLFDGLSARNRLETATVCVTGLCGERLDERPDRMFTHGVDLYEPSLRVPLLFRFPAQDSRGLQVSRLGQLIDVGPTLANFALRQPWPSTSGHSLKEAIRAQTAVDKAVFAQGFVQDAPGAPAVPAAAVRVTTGKGAVKLVVAQDGAVLGAWRFPDDPGEQTSLHLAGQQLQLLVQGWTKALGEQAGCVPVPR